MRVEKQKVNSRRPAIHGNRQLLTNWLLVDIKPSRHTLQSRRHSTSHSHFDHGGGDASDMALGLRSVCRVCPGWGGVASLCARSRGEPSSAHCEQRLSERLTPCPCDPVCACTGMRGHAGKGKKRTNDATKSKSTLHFCPRTHTQRSEP